MTEARNENARASIRKAMDESGTTEFLKGSREVTYTFAGFECTHMVKSVREEIDLVWHIFTRDAARGYPESLDLEVVTSLCKADRHPFGS